MEFGNLRSRAQPFDKPFFDSLRVVREIEPLGALSLPNGQGWHPYTFPVLSQFAPKTVSVGGL